MHSSSVRTIHCSGHLREGESARGLFAQVGVGGCCLEGGLHRGCLPRGSVCLRDVCPGAGVCPGGGCLPRGVSTRRGCLSSREVSAQGGVPRQTPALWTEFLTHACKNITFLQLLVFALFAVKKTVLSNPNTSHLYNCINLVPFSFQTFVM